MTTGAKLYDREYLIPRALTYVFSLRIRYTLGIARSKGDNKLQKLPEGLGLQLKPCPTTAPGESDSYLVFGAGPIRTPSGQVLEYPNCRLAQGSSILKISNESSEFFKGTLLFELEGRGVLELDHTGRLTVPGATMAINRWIERANSRRANNAGERLPPLSGDVRISLRSAIDVPRFRWMVLNQLVGVGKVSITLVDDETEPRLDVDTDYDLYLGSPR